MSDTWLESWDEQEAWNQKCRGKSPPDSAVKLKLKSMIRNLTLPPAWMPRLLRASARCVAHSETCFCIPGHGHASAVSGSGSLVRSSATGADVSRRGPPVRSPPMSEHLRLEIASAIVRGRPLEPGDLRISLAGLLTAPPAADDPPPVQRPKSTQPAKRGS